MAHGPGEHGSIAGGGRDRIQRQAIRPLPTRLVIALDDTQSSAPVRNFHLLREERACPPSTCARIRRGQAARGVVWAGVDLGEELVEVMARQRKLPIGAHRKGELVGRSSMDICHPVECGW
jgi:hypothetical protein